MRRHLRRFCWCFLLGLILSLAIGVGASWGRAEEWPKFLFRPWVIVTDTHYEQPWRLHIVKDPAYRAALMWTFSPLYQTVNMHLRRPLESPEHHDLAYPSAERAEQLLRNLRATLAEHPLPESDLSLNSRIFDYMRDIAQIDPEYFSNDNWYSALELNREARPGMASLIRIPPADGFEMSYQAAVFGWPLRVVASHGVCTVELITTESGARKIDYQFTTDALGSYKRVDFDDSTKGVAWKPLWLSLIANSLIFAVPPFLMLLLLCTLRRWRRRRRGLCPGCAYCRAGLPASAPCPECGWAAPPPRPAPINPINSR